VVEQQGATRKGKRVAQAKQKYRRTQHLHRTAGDAGEVHPRLSDMKIHPLFGTLLVALATVIACNPEASISRNDRGFFIAQVGTDERSFKVVQLPSGKPIKVVAIRKLVFAPGGDPPALTLLYQTDLPLRDTAALKNEVLEIWATFQHDVEREGLSSALITAAEPAPAGPTWHRNTYAFAFKKDAAGMWRLAQ
jgi:hypothetical protein